MSFIYIASPYTHKDPWIREERYLRASRVLTQYLRDKRWAYSPIVHCHELAKVDALPHDAEFWREYDFAMLATAAELHVLRIEGWEDSLGVRAEIDEATRLGKRIWFI